MAKHIEFKSGGRNLSVTLATQSRIRILMDNVDVILSSWRNLEKQEGMELICWAILPDHFHVIINTNFRTASKLIHAFKLYSARMFHGSKVAGRGPLWDGSGWKQVINSQQELEKHIDFVHYNPVKHGLVTQPWDYEHSSFREFVEHGYYARDWSLDNSGQKSMEEIEDTDVG